MIVCTEHAAASMKAQVKSPIRPISWQATSFGHSEQRPVQT